MLTNHSSVQRPVQSPVQGPVHSPVHSPVLSPVHSPVQGPVQGPVPGPVHGPVQRPVQTFTLIYLSAHYRYDTAKPDAWVTRHYLRSIDKAVRDGLIPQLKEEYTLA